MELRRRFEGPNASEMRCAKALSLLESLVYKNERETPFEGMINKLNKAYVVLHKYGGQEFTDIMKVDALAKRFVSTQNQNITLRIALEQMKAMYRANYREAVAYMSSKIAEINAANRSITGNPRRISQAESTVSVRDRNGNVFTSFHDVDLRNPTRHYSDDEMTALGFRGRAILAEMRRIANQDGNSGGRGRGNGGRGYNAGGRGGRGRGFGRGRGRGRGYGGRYGGRGYQNNNSNTGNNENNRQVNATDRTNAPAPDAAASASTQNQNQGQNGNQASAASARGNQNGSGYGQH